MATEDYHPAAPAGPLPTPLPPNVGLPVNRVPGRVTADFPDGDVEGIANKADGYSDTGRLTSTPVPLIGAVPYGGLVASTGTASLSLGQSVVIGNSAGVARPSIMGILLSSRADVWSFEVVADGQRDQPAAGMALPVGVVAATALFVPPLWLPLQRVTIRARVAGPVVVEWAVIAYPNPEP